MNIQLGNPYTIAHNLSLNSISEHIPNMKRKANIIVRLCRLIASKYERARMHLISLPGLGAQIVSVYSS